ncbi:helix-turn-helix domain-containing protein [Blautia sp. HCP3S3_G3]|uniref:helix-turn-helix domain-containing protein n=1 Tax=Blautia sp. HCP3S3_G3 TaxID=3438913 RepID=UPI003F8B1B13
MIYYGKLFELMKAQGKNTTHIRNEKIVSQDTLGKLRKGTGIIDEGRDPNNILPNGKQAKKIRITAVDTKSIESLCTWLNCQPSDIMEVIPNTWDNADRLCEILGEENKPLPKEDLPSRVPMEEK